MSKTNTDQEKLFFRAIESGDISQVTSLVKSEPRLLDSYDYGYYGATPITRICFNANLEMIGKLIDLGADVDRRSDWNMGPWSPLHSAVFCRDTALANYLLERGATLDVHAAAGTSRVQELKNLLDQDPARVTEQGGDGCHPLHFADSAEIAQLLLDRGADIEARCIDHYSTPIQYLANHRPEVARYLFSLGAKADIFSAIMANDRAVVQKLIDANPNVLQSRVTKEYFPPGPDHQVDNILTFSIGENCTPLHAAATKDRVDFVRLLLDAGHHPDERGGYDDGSALHLAAWNDSRKVAEALLDAGANIDQLSGEIHNNTPAGWAIVGGSANVFELLMDRGTKVMDYFRADAQAGLDGKFLKYKRVSHENYERIAARLEKG